MKKYLNTKVGFLTFSFTLLIIVTVFVGFKIIGGTISINNDSNQKECEQKVQLEKLSCEETFASSSVIENKFVTALEAVNDHENKFNGDAEGLAENSLSLCKSVATSREELVECSSKVFNKIANYFISGEHNLILNTEDPLWLCKLQNNDVKAPCYGLLARLYLEVNNGDFTQSMNQAEALTNNQYMYNVIANVAVIHVQNKHLSSKKYLMSCRSLKADLQLYCIQGTAIGLFQSGELSSDYEKTIDFCNLLLGKDKDTCFQKMFPYFRDIYEVELDKICGLIEDKYQKQCLQN